MTTVEDTFTMGGSDQRFMKRLFMTPQQKKHLLVESIFLSAVKQKSCNQNLSNFMCISLQTTVVEVDWTNGQ